jgi:hypothetical protein
LYFIDFYKDSQDIKESKVKVVLLGLTYMKFEELRKGQLSKNQFSLFSFFSDRNRQYYSKTFNCVSCLCFELHYENQKGQSKIQCNTWNNRGLQKFPWWDNFKTKKKLENLPFSTPTYNMTFQILQSTCFNPCLGQVYSLQDSLSDHFERQTKSQFRTL